MTAIAGGPPFPLLHIDRHTHTPTHKQNTWCAIGFVGTWRHKNIHRELIVTVKATSNQTPQQEPEKLQTHAPTSSHTHRLFCCVCIYVRGLDPPECFTHSRGFKSCCVFRREGRCWYVRCDWETILVRLRPLESTWLDMLLAVDKGCLVRTRPVL